MKAIVPAAGIGTRLRPHTYTLPKALLYVAGRPIISHILDEIRTLDVSSVVLIVGYKGDLIQEYVTREYPDLHIDFVYQEERQGIGHAIYLTREVADAGEPVLVILGDTIIQTDLKGILKCENNALALKEVEDPRRFGVAELDGNRIVKLVEKPEHPKSNLAIVGLYYVRDSRALFTTLADQIKKDIRTRGEYQITDTLQMMIDSGLKFTSYPVHQWFDCGKPETLLETNRQLLKGSSTAPKIKGSIVIEPVAISPSAKIKNSIIGPHVSIASDSTVENSIVRDSVIDQGARVSNCLLESSIIGSHATIDSGFQKLNIGDSSEVVFK